MALLPASEGLQHQLCKLVPVLPGMGIRATRDCWATLHLERKATFGVGKGRLEIMECALVAGTCLPCVRRAGVMQSVTPNYRTTWLTLHHDSSAVAFRSRFSRNSTTLLQGCPCIFRVTCALVAIRRHRSPKVEGSERLARSQFWAFTSP